MMPVSLNNQLFPMFNSQQTYFDGLGGGDGSNGIWIQDVGAGFVLLKILLGKLGLLVSFKTYYFSPLFS